MSNKYIAIIDHVGRNIVGKQVGETDTTVTINNPVILHCQPEANGQLQVQSFPVFFFEFISKQERDKNDWTYSKANIVTSNVVLDERIIAQYSKINTPQEAVVENNPKVISINDI
jgi:phosphoribulokinase